MDCEDCRDVIIVVVDSIEDSLDNDENIDVDKDVDENVIVGSKISVVWFTARDGVGKVWLLLIDVDIWTDEVWLTDAVIDGKVWLLLIDVDIWTGVVWFAARDGVGKVWFELIDVESFINEDKFDNWLIRSDDDAWLVLMIGESFVDKEIVFWDRTTSIRKSFFIFILIILQFINGRFNFR